MGVEWFVRVKGKVKGPFTAGQLKALARSQHITAGSSVRKGDDGQWVRAGRVRGLFDDSAQDDGRKTSAVSPVSTPPAELASDAEPVPLVPDRRRWPRMIVLAGLVLFALIGEAAWYNKFFFSALMALMLGSYPRQRITPRSLECEFVVFFLSIHTKRWPLRDYVAIGTDTEPPLPFWTVIFMGITWPMVRFLDFAFPWVGGSYKLWLRTWERERVLAWQGHGDADFQHNLEILQEISGLPVER